MTLATNCSRKDYSIYAPRPDPIQPHHFQRFRRRHHEPAERCGHVQSDVSASGARCAAARLLPAGRLRALPAHTKMRALPQSRRGECGWLAARMRECAFVCVRVPVCECVRKANDFMLNYRHSRNLIAKRSTHLSRVHMCHCECRKRT